jgi:hypothetical protein
MLIVPLYEGDWERNRKWFLDGFGTVVDDNSVETEWDTRKKVEAE